MINIRRPFYFIRHGETKFNEQKRFQGSIDEPLNQRGIEQAYIAAQKIKDGKLPIDLVVSSHLKRAHKTAEVIGEELGVPVLTHPGIAEKGYGILEGTFIEDLPKNLQANPDAFIDPTGLPELEGSETYAEFQERVRKAINETLEEHGGKNILYVAHTTVYCSMHIDIYGEKVVPDNAHPFHFDKQGDKWEIKKI